MSVSEAVTLIGAVTAAIVSVMNAVVAFRNSGRLTEVHQMVNGQSTRLLDLTAATSRAQGVSEGVGIATAKEPPGVS